MKPENIVGKVVDITDKESMYYGSWGTVVLFDGEYFHVKDANGETTPIFRRNEFRVRRNQSKALKQNR